MTATTSTPPAFGSREIAKAMKCNARTARRLLHRLWLAGEPAVQRRGKAYVTTAEAIAPFLPPECRPEPEPTVEDRLTAKIRETRRELAEERTRREALAEEVYQLRREFHAASSAWYRRGQPAIKNDGKTG